VRLQLSLRGNPLTPAEQETKLRLAMQDARQVWPG
jgi:hypothetical protein